MNGSDRYIPDIDMWKSRASQSRRPIALAAAALVLLVVMANTLYQIQPEEVGVVLRLGKFVRTTEPGLRVKIPFVEEVRKVQVQRQLKEEFGFRTEAACFFKCCQAVA